VALLTAVGVPEMAPVEFEKDSPAGSVPVSDHDTTVPPFEVGVAIDMVVSLVNVRKLGLYDTEDGAMSLTTIVTVAVPLPPAFVAVIV
tara:strand:+ start:2080 stop:2343 length:264 start_codon:yes stop_codon:yes gene_type:complete